MPDLTILALRSRGLAATSYQLLAFSGHARLNCLLGGGQLVPAQKFPGVSVDSVGEIMVVMIVVSEFDVVNREPGLLQKVPCSLNSGDWNELIAVADVDGDRRLPFGLIHD